MYAVVRSGGKQYRVAPNYRISVEKLTAEPGATVTLGDVLMIGGGSAAPLVGTPMVDGATVLAEVVEHIRADKVIIFKKKRRKNHRRLKGHRQHLTVLRITDIAAEGFDEAVAAAPATVETAPVPGEAAAIAPEATATDLPDAPESDDKPKE